MQNKVPEIVDWFGRLNAIPRCSGSEAAVADWIRAWADESGFGHRSDAAGNLIIDIPASTGYESAPRVIFQAHMDMVCEKTPDSEHDFSRDPIVLVEAGEWLMAEDTSLGADNGAAIAMGMVLVTDPTVAHPPLELLFTVDEETGLNGAKQLPENFIRGSILLNVDSEDEGVFTVGCAGGIDTLMTCGFKLERVPTAYNLIEISVGGMRGGHSGIDIGKHRANANRVLARLLEAAGRCQDLRLVALAGGSKHNAIPREARATVALPPGALAETEGRLHKLGEDIVSEFQTTERELAIRVENLPASDACQGLSVADTCTAVTLMLITPTGVIETIPGQADRVETSCNLAITGLENGQFSLLVSQRSQIMSRLAAINTQVEAVAAMAGVQFQTTNKYPAWPADETSPLLERCRQTYRACFSKEPIVETIHAGLECAVIGSKYPGMDMISFGPTMKNPHSPGEKLNVPSIGKLWEFLVELMASFKPEAA